MMQRKKYIALTSFILLLATNISFGQSMVDFSIGTSNADYVFGTIAYRRQLSDRFRLGLEAQFGSVRYRFIEAKPITEGYSTMISVPILYKLYETDHIRLDFYARAGIRFQGIIDPDNNDVRDETLTSTAINVEPGLVVSIPISKKWMIHSGVTIPNLFELSPEFLFENSTSAITAGCSHQTSKNGIVFLKTLAGPSVGADSDSQKFSWSIQAGFRFLIGKEPNSNSLVLESSF